MPFGIDPAKLLEIVRRNGCVVIEGVLSSEQIVAVNKELDEAFAAEKFAGDWVPEDDPFRGFLGNKTKRVMHCVGKSKTYCDAVLGSPMIYEYAKAVLSDAGPDVAIMATQGMGLMPGQPAQELHRDQQYPFLEPMGAAQPCVLCNMMLALVDFTDEIGATRVIPGSHKWKAWYRQPTMEMTVAAEMKAGDIFFFDGKTIHGGGANRTANQMRRSIATGFCSSLIAFGGRDVAAGPEDARLPLVYSGRCHGLWLVDRRPQDCRGRAGALAEESGGTAPEHVERDRQNDGGEDRAQHALVG